MGDTFLLPKTRGAIQDRVTPLHAREESDSSGEEDAILVETVSEENVRDGTSSWKPHLVLDGLPETIIPEEEVVDNQGRPLCFESFSSQHINSEVLLPHEDVLQLVKVVRRLIHENGK